MAMSAWSWFPGPAFDTPEGTDPSKIWNRKLWGGEILFAYMSKMGTGRHNLQISCIMDVPDGVAFSHQHVRAAMRCLRFAHPSIASKVVWPPGPPNPAEAKFQYASPVSEEQVNAWLDTVVVQITNSSSDVETALSSLQIALARLDAPQTDDQLKVYHVLPSPLKPCTHGILLYAKHVLFDAIAAWEALDCYLQELALLSGNALMAPLDWGTEYVRLARAVADRTERKFEPADMHGEWPELKRAQQIKGKPLPSFGIPVPHLDAPTTGMDYLSTVFSEEVTASLLKASRRHGPKMFSVQTASIVVTCLRINPIPPDSCGQRVTIPGSPVSLRPILSKNGSSEIVSAAGSYSLEVSDVSKYYPVEGDKETVAAVWAIAKDLQEQLVMQKPWMYNVSKSAPIAMKFMMEKFVGGKPPPPLPLRLFTVMTNLGIMDQVVKHEYPIANSQSSLKIVRTFFHVELLESNPTHLPAALHTFTWDNKLHYSWSYLPNHMGERGGKNEEGPATLAKFIDELEKVTILLSKDT